MRRSTILVSVITALMLLCKRFSAESAFDIYTERKEEFGISDDHFFVHRLFCVLAAAEYTKNPVVFNIGLNEATLVYNMVKCKTSGFSRPNIHSFDIDEKYVTGALNTLHSRYKVGTQATELMEFHHMGVSDKETIENVGGRLGVGGLYNDNKMRAHYDKRTMKMKKRAKPWGVPRQSKPVKTFILSKFCSEKNISRVEYTTIDVEGHEVNAIKGMELQQESNRNRFPAFQFEVGGTWASDDPRRIDGATPVKDMAVYLTRLGYSIFMIGRKSIIIDDIDTFFNKSDKALNGRPVDTNMLAVHKKYAHPVIISFLEKDLVKSQTWVPVEDVAKTTTMANVTLIC